MGDRLLIDIAGTGPEGKKTAGEADIIDLEEALVHPFGPARYALEVQVFGTEVLVRGRLEQDFDLVCSRCGKDFDTTIKVEDFTVSYEVGENDLELDISEDAREALLLELPNFPLCDEACEGVERASGEGEMKSALAEALEALESSSAPEKRK